MSGFEMGKRHYMAQRLPEKDREAIYINMLMERRHQHEAAIQSAVEQERERCAWKIKELENRILEMEIRLTFQCKHPMRAAWSWIKFYVGRVFGRCWGRD